MQEYATKTGKLAWVVMLLGALMITRWGQGTITVGAAFGLFVAGAGFGAVVASAYLASRPQKPIVPPEKGGKEDA